MQSVTGVLLIFTAKIVKAIVGNWTLVKDQLLFGFPQNALQLF